MLSQSSWMDSITSDRKSTIWSRNLRISSIPVLICSAAKAAGTGADLVN
jgi:hypothetical protein